MTIGDEFPQVLAAAQAGDARAIEYLYRDTSGLILGYVRANGAREPEDVTSEVYVSMLASLDRFEGGETSFRSWLLTIAHRRLVDGFRRTARRPEDPTPSATLVGVIDLTDNESEAMGRLRAMGILDAIDSLTPDQRAVLLLRALADRSIRDIAVIVDKPETAVKALLRRGIAALTRVLDERGQGSA